MPGAPAGGARRQSIPPDRSGVSRDPEGVSFTTHFRVIITYNDVMASSNTFIYGEIVTATAFADREGERDRLERDLSEGQKVFLISPRRYGKSSLVRAVMKSLA